MKQFYLITMLALLLLGCGPTPQPPKPDPDIPPVIVVTSGVREMVIFYESTDRTPELGIMFTELRDGDPETYLKDKGHTLFILDVDTPDQNGNKAAIIQKYAEDLAGSVLPLLVIKDPKTGKTLLKEHLPNETEASVVMSKLKANGG